MSVGGYKIRNQGQVHFITFAVVEWIDVFTRRIYRDLVLDSLRFCQLEKKLAVHAWCLMSNHVHFVLSAPNGNLSDILRDFKRFTSSQIINSMKNNPEESRKEWMLRIFWQQGQRNSRNKNYQFWRQDNQPKECYSSRFTVQKINYIHNNPVEAGIVQKPEHYLYSSAIDY
ncbi:MAG TPA: transposase, partial [Chitinophagaceae bacterium]|nr:transposase [Chitinophagaceae bacterium]